ncbi:hypothetical protein LEMLEM_LOCUS244 [Lemmus lemmus]
MYAVCQRMLAPARLTFHDGGIIKKLGSVPSSSMVVAMGTLTTSKVKVSVHPSVKNNVSAKGPQPAI